MSKLRKAEDKDIADLVELTIEFCRSTAISKLAEVSVEKITETFLTYIVDKKGIVWVIEGHQKGLDGFIAGHIGEFAFSRDKVASVACWWAKKNKHFFDHADMLLSMFEVDAKSQGANNVIVASLGIHLIEEKYRKENYKQYELIYIKDLR